MKYAQLAMATLLLTLPIGCSSLYGGVPLPPELQAILDSMPPDPPGYRPPAILFPDIEERIAAEKKATKDQIQTLTDSHGNYIGQLRYDGSSGISTIVNQKGDYMGRIDKNGIISNQRGTTSVKSGNIPPPPPYLG